MSEWRSGAAGETREYVDMWPKGTVNREAVLAYLALEAEGLLEIVAVTDNWRRGGADIRYRTAKKRGWIRRQRAIREEMLAEKYGRLWREE